MYCIISYNVWRCTYTVQIFKDVSCIWYLEYWMIFSIGRLFFECQGVSVLRSHSKYLSFTWYSQSARWLVAVKNLIFQSMATWTLWQLFYVALTCLFLVRKCLLHSRGVFAFSKRSLPGQNYPHLVPLYVTYSFSEKYSSISKHVLRKTLWNKSKNMYRSYKQTHKL